MQAHEEDLNDLYYDRERKRWMRKDGKSVPDDVQARLRAAGTPPGWTQVSLNPDGEAGLQVRGLDEKGRVQSRYSKEHSESAATEKFARLQAFNEAMKSGSPRIEAMIKDESLPDSARDAAAALRLIERTAIRVGSDRETGGAVKAYGATTLLGKHITLSRGGGIRLSFQGKSGQLNERSFRDPVLYRYLSGRIKGPEDRVFSASDARVRAVTKEALGRHFMPKDFRTWHGTAIAIEEMGKLGMPKSKREAQAFRRRVAEVVSSRLSNTPSVALKSYIDPAVFGHWGKCGAGRGGWSRRGVHPSTSCAKVSAGSQ
jgi:DNA topoisomerase-1